jgi:hypothetical protein
MIHSIFTLQITFIFLPFLRRLKLEVLLRVLVFWSHDFVLAVSHTGIASHHTFQLNGLQRKAFAHMALFVGNVHSFSRQWQLGYLPSSNSYCL